MWRSFAFLKIFLLLAFELFPCLEINRLIFVRQRGREINTWMFASFSLILMPAWCKMRFSRIKPNTVQERPPLTPPLYKIIEFDVFSQKSIGCTIYKTIEIWCFFTKIYRMYPLQNHRHLMFFFSQKFIWCTFTKSSKLMFFHKNLCGVPFTKSSKFEVFLRNL